MVISVGPVVDDERRRMRGGKCLRRVLEFAVESDFGHFGRVAVGGGREPGDRVGVEAFGRIDTGGKELVFVGLGAVANMARKKLI
jgi:hypothetical protein